MAWVVKRQKLNFKKVFFWNTLLDMWFRRSARPLFGQFWQFHPASIREFCKFLNLLLLPTALGHWCLWLACSRNLGECWPQSNALVRFSSPISLAPLILLHNILLRKILIDFFANVCVNFSSLAHFCVKFSSLANFVLILAPWHIFVWQQAGY